MESIGIESAEIPKFRLSSPSKLFAFDAQDDAWLLEIQKEIDALKILLGFCTASVAFLLPREAELWEFRRAVENEEPGLGSLVRDLGEGVGCVIFFLLRS